MTKLDEFIQLSITDFRSVEGTAVIPLDAPIVLIHGTNGSGKTSVLSALELALTGDIPSMRNEDGNFARHLVHEGARQAEVTVTGDKANEFTGRYIIADGMLTGTPYLESGDQKFFGER